MPLQLIYTDIADFKMNDSEAGRLMAAVPLYFAQKAEASKNGKLKMQRLASGLLFMYSMRRSGCEAEDIMIFEGPYGKPMLISPEGLYFNLSHSYPLVLLAVCDAEVGCDIQKIENGKRVAERFFTDTEKLALDEADESERDRVFTRLWTRKESYIKATGEGMRHDLRSFSVMDDFTPDGYAFAGFEIEDQPGSVCVRCRDIKERESLDTGDITFTPFQTLANVIS